MALFLSVFGALALVAFGMAVLATTLRDAFDGILNALVGGVESAPLPGWTPRAAVRVTRPVRMVPMPLRAAA